MPHLLLKISSRVFLRSRSMISILMRCVFSQLYIWHIQFSELFRSFFFWKFFLHFLLPFFFFHLGITSCFSSLWSWNDFSWTPSTTKPIISISICCTQSDYYRPWAFNSFCICGSYIHAYAQVHLWSSMIPSLVQSLGGSPRKHMYMNFVVLFFWLVNCSCNLKQNIVFLSVVKKKEKKKERKNHLWIISLWLISLSFLKNCSAAEIFQTRFNFWQWLPSFHSKSTVSR